MSYHRESPGHLNNNNVRLQNLILTIKNPEKKKGAGVKMIDIVFIFDELCFPSIPTLRGSWCNFQRDTGFCHKRKVGLKARRR